MMERPVELGVAPDVEISLISTLSQNVRIGPSEIVERRGVSVAMLRAPVIGIPVGSPPKQLQRSRSGRPNRSERHSSPEGFSNLSGTVLQNWRSKPVLRVAILGPHTGLLG